MVRLASMPLDQDYLLAKDNILHVQPARDSQVVKSGATLAAEPNGCYHSVDQRMMGQRQLKVIEEIVMLIYK